MYVSMAQSQACSTEWNIVTFHFHLMWPSFALIVTINTNIC